MHSFRRDVKGVTHTHRLAIAAWRAAGHFTAVQQDGVSFHFGGVNLQTFTRRRDVWRRVLIACLAGFAGDFTQIAEWFAN
ncbi:hypothetical protein D3C77_678820 [compost metagenome]